MARLTEPGEVGRRGRLNMFGGARSGGGTRPARTSAPQRPPRQASSTAPAPDPAPGRNSGQARAADSSDNVDRSLRERIRRLSAARESLRRRHDHGAEDEAHDLAVNAEPEATPRRPAESFVETGPASEPEQVTEPVAEPSPRREPESYREPAGDAGSAGSWSGQTRDYHAEPEPAAAPRANSPRQSAVRRSTPDREPEGKAAGSDHLPATRRQTAPEPHASRVRPAEGDGGDVETLSREVAALRKELSELRRDVQAIKSSGPGNLGPLERAVQKLSQRLDRVDGGARPAVEDVRESGPRHVGRQGKGGFFGLFRS